MQTVRAALVNGNLVRLGVLGFMGAITSYLMIASRKYGDEQGIHLMAVLWTVTLIFYLLSFVVTSIFLSSTLAPLDRAEEQTPTGE